MPRPRLRRRSITALLGPALAAALLSSGASVASACTPTRQFSLNGVHVHYKYRLCDAGDIDQVRVPPPGSMRPRLINNGYLYCVPTSAIDLMIHIAKIGYASKPVPGDDYSDPANFDEMTRDIQEMAADMGTTGLGPTPAGPALAGIDTWLHNHGTPVVGASFGGLAVEHLFAAGDRVKGIDVGTMALTAISGALVMPGVAFVDRKTGVQNGGHFVALAAADGTVGAASSTIGVRDPFTTHHPDAIQSPQKTDTWTLTPAGTGRYDVSSPYYDTTSLKAVLGSYITIEPKTALTVSKDVVNVDGVLSLFDGHPVRVKHLEPARHRRLRDVALSPYGGAVPFLTAGSSAVHVLNRLTRRTTLLAKGPAGASHLAVGGPNLRLYVAGAKRLVAFDRAGHRVASTPLAKRIDALAFDATTNRLAALSTAGRSVRLFTGDLKPAGGLRLPSAFTSGRGTPALAIGKDGELELHRDGARSVASIDTGQQAKASSFPLASLRAQALGGVKAPRGLAIDDDGHIFVSDAGHVVELDADGEPVANSAYAGTPGGSIVRIDRSYSNAPPDLPLDFLPDAIINTPDAPPGP